MYVWHFLHILGSSLDVCIVHTLPAVFDSYHCKNIAHTTNYVIEASAYNLAHWLLYFT